MPLVVCARSLKAELQTGDRKLFLTPRASAVSSFPSSLQLRRVKAIRYPSSMNLQEVALERIDWDDERFRISEELFPERLAQSLSQVGQLSPVRLLVGDGPRYMILCG